MFNFNLFMCQFPNFTLPWSVETKISCSKKYLAFPTTNYNDWREMVMVNMIMTMILQRRISGRMVIVVMITIIIVTLPLPGDGQKALWWFLWWLLWSWSVMMIILPLPGKGALLVRERSDDYFDDGDWWLQKL